MKQEGALGLRRGDRVTFGSHAYWRGTYPLAQDPIVKDGPFKDLIYVLLPIEYQGRALTFNSNWFSDSTRARE